ncbi:MAG TPA: 2,3-diaminopropionate biosynthesis protein SbnA [Blattabacteriaceae bacterium]|nr:2,3-diaminopropionate biosynthesis protein SbnA [Blattabacteriaceae bacterium]
MHAQHRLFERLSFAERIIRDTPVVPLSHPIVDLYTKLEYMNGVGSIKDRPALWVLKRAIERGEIRQDTTIVESSSGNFACALATFCQILKLKFVPVIDSLILPVYESYLRAYCEDVAKVEQSDESGSYLKARLRKVQSILHNTPNSYWTNQYENLDGMAAHYELTAPEIYRAVPELDYIFLGVSSGGTIAGVSRRLKEHSSKIRVIAVDAEGSVIFGQPPKKRSIPGIGSSISPGLVKQALIDEVIIVPEIDAVNACHTLLSKHGLFVGGSTGTVYSAIESYFATRQFSGRPKVLFLCCDKGTAYLHTVYDPDWAIAHLSGASPDVPYVSKAVNV